MGVIRTALVSLAATLGFGCNQVYQLQSWGSSIWAREPQLEIEDKGDLYPLLSFLGPKFLFPLRPSNGDNIWIVRRNKGYAFIQGRWYQTEMEDLKENGSNKEV